ncbi:MAG: hypothetical protein WBG38_06510 [Nodosilinea sp.]
MKRKSKPLITGGLLGLAGLGLLPQAAEANTDLPPAPDPSLGAALAEDPSPVIVPEPSAQTTEPEDEQSAAQPVWTPEAEPVAAAAPQVELPAPVTEAVPQAELVASEPVARLVPKVELPVLAVAEAVETVPQVEPFTEPVAEAIPQAELAISEPVAEVIPQAELAVPALEPGPGSLAAVSPDSGQRAEPPSGSAVAETAIAPSEAVNSTVSTSASPTRNATAIASPALAPDIPAAPPALAPPEAPALTLEEGGAGTVAIDSSPAAAPLSSQTTTPPAQPVSRTAPDLTTLRSRAAAVQGLLHDLRSAYGIEDSLTAVDSTAAPVASARQVTRPETLSQEPQLPPLPSRSARRSEPRQRSVSAVVAPVDSSSVQPRSQARGPQLPSLSGQAPNVALALPTPQPVMSSRGSILPSVENAAPPAVASSLADTSRAAAIAQGTPSTQDASQIRDELRVEPLTVTSATALSFPPSPNAGIPSAFGAEWGDVFISASLSGADRLRGEADGSLSMGFGLGDSRRAVGVQLAYNLQSIRQFGENGSFDVKVHREVYSSNETQVAAAVGLNNFASYGANTVGTASSLYGVVSAAHLLQPDNPGNRLPITASLGLGGGNFAEDGTDVGIIAGVGLQVHPQVSVNTAWSGVGLNVGASIVPDPTVPLTLNLLYGDVGNNTRAGSVAVLSVGYGFNFGPRF